jgi:hypothetical protein
MVVPSDAVEISKGYSKKEEVTMKRFVYFLVLAALLMVPAMTAGALETLTIGNPRNVGNDVACFDFTDTLGTLTFNSARLAVWDRQDNPSFQTLSDWGATFTATFDEFGNEIGTICVPGVLSDHCNKPGPMKIFFKLRDVTKPSRTTAKLVWDATCP